MTAKDTNRKKSGWRRFAEGVLWTFTFIACLGLVAASFGGNFQPSVYRGLCLMVMTLPLWIIAVVVMTVLDALWCRKALIASLITLIACAPAMWEYSPLNLVTPSQSKYRDCPKFTFMTYNVSNFATADRQYPNGQNPTASYILKMNADVVCLQESRGIGEYGPVSDAQMDSLRRAYPYQLLYGYSQMLLSKYPAEPLPTGTMGHGGNEIAVFRINVEGTPVTIFDVHLQSYALSNDDKGLYQDITKFRPEDNDIKQDFLDVKSQLLSKIQLAAEKREVDAERLGRYVQHYAGANAIIAGDFNDVPGCYTLRRMADFNFKQVYEKLGFGPMITFNADRFYFRIDHILYRGNIMPLYIQRGNIKSSDHYPLITAFAITKQEK